MIEHRQQELLETRIVVRVGVPTNREVTIGVPKDADESLLDDSPRSQERLSKQIYPVINPHRFWLLMNVEREPTRDWSTTREQPADAGRSPRPVPGDAEQHHAQLTGGNINHSCPGMSSCSEGGWQGILSPLQFPAATLPT